MRLSGVFSASERPGNFGTYKSILISDQSSFRKHNTGNQKQWNANLVSDRQPDNELCKFPFFGIYFYLPSMCFDNVITQAQTQSCSLTCWFGGEERLKDFVNCFLSNAIAVVTNADAYPIPRFFYAD